MPCSSFSTRTRCASSSASGSVALDVPRSALKKPMAHANGSGRNGWSLKQLNCGICLASHTISAATAEAQRWCCCRCCCSAGPQAGIDVAAWPSLMTAPRASMCANKSIGSLSTCVECAARAWIRVFAAAARCFRRGQKSPLDVPGCFVTRERRWLEHCAYRVARTMHSEKEESDVKGPSVALAAKASAKKGVQTDWLFWKSASGMGRRVQICILSRSSSKKR